MGKLLYLNCVWVLFSLPLITIIPSTFALIRFTTIWICDGSTPTVSYYAKQLRLCFKDSYLFFIPIVFVLFIVWLDVHIMAYAQNNLWFYCILLIAVIFSFVAHFAIFIKVNISVNIRQSWILAIIMVGKRPFVFLGFILGYGLLALLWLFQTGLAICYMASLAVFILCKLCLFSIEEIELLKETLS
ncbi:DUF624 domain-containing protein [Fundicoccus culcitae]|uniref:DUF624 domain-containing protein n=1 Tax=Fundicoccus culcitae TaxID=2969821 RepID=UPI0036F1E6CA